MKDLAIQVKNISKQFRIPHEKITSLRGAAVSVFKKKTYEEFNALENVSFDVKKGEFFGIIGRNGSGKSTLLKILAGIYQADKGTVEVDGMISPFLELGIGFNPELSGRDNIYLNATVLGMTQKQIDEKFDSIVAFSELERFIDQKLKNYSSGMQVRLAFSVSIHANRDILLMDEVLAVGDSNFQKKCIDVFRSYRENDKTVILVTHDISSVRRYCSRALLLHNGKIAKIGDVDEVCDEYVVKNMTTGARAELQENEKMRKNEVEREKDLKLKLINKKQVIMDVREYASNKKELMSIARGDSFYVDVEIYLQEICDGLHVAVQLFDKNTECFISGNNTQIDEYVCKWQIGKNKMRVNFDKVNLNNGLIYTRVILFIYNPGDNIILDEVISDNAIKVCTDKASSSMVYLEHKWN